MRNVNPIYDIDKGTCDDIQWLQTREECDETFQYLHYP